MKRRVYKFEKPGEEVMEEVDGLEPDQEEKVRALADQYCKPRMLSHAKILFTEEEMDTMELEGCPCARCRVARGQEIPSALLAEMVADIATEVEEIASFYSGLINADWVPDSMKAIHKGVALAAMNLDVSYDMMKLLTVQMTKQIIEDQVEEGEDPAEYLNGLMDKVLEFRKRKTRKNIVN